MTAEIGDSGDCMQVWLRKKKRRHGRSGVDDPTKKNMQPSIWMKLVRLYDYIRGIIDMNEVRQACAQEAGFPAVFQSLVLAFLWCYDCVLIA